MICRLLLAQPSELLEPGNEDILEANGLALSAFYLKVYLSKIFPRPEFILKLDSFTPHRGERKSPLKYHDPGDQRR
jgi:hypothetical protein